MYILSFGMWFTKLVRQFFFLIDRVVFNFIPTIYNLLIDIARTSVLSQSDISDITSRIYQLLAVFMVFKVTFSLIMYVVNPDDFSDKTKGVSKLGTNIVISLSLLVLTPYIFSYAYQIQTIILEDDALGTLVFGNNDDNTSDTSMLTTAGDKIAYNTLAPFFTPNVSIGNNTDHKLMNCVTLKDEKGKFNQDCSGIDLNADELYTGEEDTLAGLANEIDSDDKKKYSPNYTETDVANYVAGVESGSIGLMFRQNMVIATAKINDDDEFIMDYKFVFSTVVGVVVVLLLLTFCMDVALRSVKLSFLQLIAPIPILSYIDPKSGKDGMFKKWYQLCFKTYASLFVRLLALYFGVFIIGKIDRISDVVNGSYQSSMFVKIFVIIGVLMFVKQLPKILEGLGIKLDGDGKFTLNPLKKFENEAFGGKRIAGAAGAMVAGAAERGARFATTQGAMGKLSSLAGAPFGLAGAALRGFRSNSGFGGGLNKQAEVNRRLRESRIKGLSPGSAYLDYVGSQFGLDDATLEKEATLIQKNKDAIAKANREVADQTRQNDLRIANEQQKMKPLKSIQSRRNEVKSASDKLMKSADDFANKKADFKLNDSQRSKLEAIDKFKKGQVTAETLNHMQNMGFNTSRLRGIQSGNADAIASSLGIDRGIVDKMTRMGSTFLSDEEKRKVNALGIDTSKPINAAEASQILQSAATAREAKAHESELAVMQRSANSNQYTTNRRTDAANVEFLTNNQGKTLEHAIVVGEGDSQVVFEAGTYVDGGIIAQAETAQGKYIKTSQKEVFDELAKGEDSEYGDTADYSAFQTDYDAYEAAKETANTEIRTYSGNNPYENLEISEFETGTRTYDEADSTGKTIGSGTDTTNITKNINETTSVIEQAERENADTKSSKKVYYYDKDGSRVEKMLSEAESEFKPWEEEFKDKREKHQERRTLLQNMANSKK